MDLASVCDNAGEGDGYPVKPTPSLASRVITGDQSCGHWEPECPSLASQTPGSKGQKIYSLTQSLRHVEPGDPMVPLHHPGPGGQSNVHHMVMWPERLESKPEPWQPQQIRFGHLSSIFQLKTDNNEKLKTNDYSLWPCWEEQIKGSTDPSSLSFGCSHEVQV